MKLLNTKITLRTKGNPDLINISAQISHLVDSSGLKNGNITIFVIGSTAAVTTFEYEPGLIKDMRELYDRLVPQNQHHYHDDTWGDANGFSHLRAAIQGPSLTVPFSEGKLMLGTWQQIVLAEFDNHPRERQIAVQIIGE